MTSFTGGDCLTPRTVRLGGLTFERYCTCGAVMDVTACIDGDGADCLQQAYRCERGHEWMQTWLAEDVAWARIDARAAADALVAPTAHSHLGRQAVAA